MPKIAAGYFAGDGPRRDAAATRRTGLKE